MENLFFVTHDIKDKEKWASSMGKWMDIFGSTDMTVDKALAYPEWEGNQCLLTCPDSTGEMCVCLWSTPVGTTKADFQAFIDRFICGSAINKGYTVEETLGASALDGRAYMREWMLSTRGGGAVGYLDKPLLWMTVHNIKDKKGWEEEIMEGMASKIRTFNTPSDCAALTPEGHGTALVLFLDEDKCICIDGSPAGISHEEYQKFVDDFTKGNAKNDVYLLNPKNGAGVMNLSEDIFNQDFLKWGESYVNPFTKTASHEATDPVHPAMDIASQ